MCILKRFVSDKPVFLTENWNLNTKFWRTTWETTALSNNHREHFAVHCKIGTSRLIKPQVHTILDGKADFYIDLKVWRTVKSTMEWKIVRRQALPLAIHGVRSSPPVFFLVPLDPQAGITPLPVPSGTSWSLSSTHTNRGTKWPLRGTGEQWRSLATVKT